MVNLYSEQNLSDIRGQLRRRLCVLIPVAVLLLAVFVFTLVIDNHKTNRPEVWSTVSLLLLGFWLIFFWDLFCRPLRKYENHMLQALNGRSHETRAEFSRVDEEESVVDGVAYRSLIFLGEPDKHGSRDLLMYWDAQLPLPPFSEGDPVRIRYFDRYLIGYEVIR